MADGLVSHPLASVSTTKTQKSTKSLNPFVSLWFPFNQTSTFRNRELSRPRAAVLRNISQIEKRLI